MKPKSEYGHGQHPNSRAALSAHHYERPAITADSPLPQRMETFCLRYFETGEGKASAIAAGYVPHSAKPRASVLLADPRIQARLAELRRRAEDASVMTVLEKRQRLAEIARADITDYLDDDGAPHIDKESPRRVAIAEYSQSTRYTKVGEKVLTRTVKVRDPLGAISEDNKMMRVYETGTSVVNNVQITEVVMVRPEPKVSE